MAIYPVHVCVFVLQFQYVHFSVRLPDYVSSRSECQIYQAWPKVFLNLINKQQTCPPRESI